MYQDAVKCISNFADAMKKVLRFHSRLLESDFKVVHSEGIKTRVGDKLALIETTGLEKTPLDE